MVDEVFMELVRAIRRYNKVCCNMAWTRTHCLHLRLAGILPAHGGRGLGRTADRQRCRQRGRRAERRRRPPQRLLWRVCGVVNFFFLDSGTR